MLTSPDEAIVRHLEIGADHPAFAGHFPGRPLLPGVALLAAVLEEIVADAGLAAFVATPPRLDVVKFLAPVRPATRLELHFRGGRSGLEFLVADGAGRSVASGRFAGAAAGEARP